MLIETTNNCKLYPVNYVHGMAHLSAYSRAVLLKQLHMPQQSNTRFSDYDFLPGQIASQQEEGQFHRFQVNRRTLTLAVMAASLLLRSCLFACVNTANLCKYRQSEKYFYNFIADLCIPNVHVQEALLMSTAVIKFNLWEPPSVLILTSCQSFPYKISPKALPGLTKRGSNAALMWFQHNFVWRIPQACGIQASWTGTMLLILKKQPSRFPSLALASLWLIFGSSIPSFLPVLENIPPNTQEEADILCQLWNFRLWELGYTFHSTLVLRQSWRTEERFAAARQIFFSSIQERNTKLKRRAERS